MCVRVGARLSAWKVNDGGREGWGGGGGYRKEGSE